MATIVMLPARRQGSPASAEQKGGATILFFTGVRYEREVEAEPGVQPEPIDPDHEEADAARVAV